MIKKFFAALVCSTIAVMPVFAVTANAVTFAQVNQDNVFVNQQEDNTCTMASNVMMIRRAAMMYGYLDWASITEDTCRAIMWSPGGMVFEYNYRVFSVVNPVIKELQKQYGVTDRKELFIRILKDHPEGVVIYDYDIPHAILLTDYTNGVFYCSDPWYGQPKKRMPMSQTNVNIYNAESVWLVASPNLYLTSNSTATSGTSSVTSGIDETWKVTDDAGLNLRSGGSLSDSIIGYVPQNATVNVTKKTYKDGYTWGYVSYNSKKGWIALEYAKKIADNTKTETVKQSEKTSETKSETAPEEVRRLPEDTHLVFDNTSTISAGEISLGSTVKLKGSASKGTAPYTYAYYSKRAASGSWAVIQDFSDKNTVELTPLAPGDYDVCIKVKDAKGNVEKKYMALKVKNTFVNQSTVSAKAYVGDEVKLTGKAKGGIGSYTYAYYQKRHDSQSWVTIKDFSSDTTASFKPLKDTAYDICIKVKDSAGNVEKVYKTLNVMKLVNRSSVSGSFMKLGNSITLRGNASGGEASYHYAFYCKKTESTSWTTLQDFSSCLVYPFKPSKTGTYDICIKVKDANGRVDKKYFTVKVTK